MVKWNHFNLVLGKGIWGEDETKIIPIFTKKRLIPRNGPD